MPAEDAAPTSVTIDEATAEVIETLLAEQGIDPASGGLRIGVEAGGCAGRMYQLQLTDGPESDDYTDACHGVNLYVDRASHEYLEGADITFTETAHGSGFRIDNPNATQECGCGLSFS